MASWHFHDLHGFKDYISFVYISAPDRFQEREGYGPNDQWTLDLAFEGLRHGLAITAKKKGELPVLATCRAMVEEAYTHYREGRDRDGCLKLQEMAKLIRKLPSR